VGLPLQLGLDRVTIAPTHREHSGAPLFSEGHPFLSPQLCLVPASRCWPRPGHREQRR